MRFLPALLVIATAVAWSDRRVTAQEPDRPTLTITRFQGSLKAPVGTEDAGADMAEVLAGRVQESGCCRVMLQSWLPGAAFEPVPFTTIRESAVAAHVEYIVTGRVAKSRVVRRPTMPSAGGVLGQMRPAGMSYPIGALPSSIRSRTPFHMPPPAQSVSIVTLDMRIVDAASGKVLRTVTITKPALTDDIALVTNSPEVADALVRAVTIVARERR
jgi:hypothetical protein